MIRSKAMLLALVFAVLAAGCSDGSSDGDAAVTPELPQSLSAPRAFDATWLINAEAVGADGPGFPYIYREAVDDLSGRFLVQSPNHLVTQHPETVIFCAAIYRSDPYCASTERAEGTPSVYSYPVQLLRSWGPVELYDLASWREVGLVADSEPESWARRTDVVRDIRVECFAVVGDTAAARMGFEICFTDDDLHLVASVDLQGDLGYEIDLQSYERSIDDESFETGLDEFIEAKASLHDQLITLFPEIPAPRPTPTPDPETLEGDGDPAEG